MSEKSAMFVAMVGLIMTLGGVGGVENSITNAELLDSVIVAVVGLMVMGCGVLAIKRQQNG
jgi:hypothetical protein